MSSFLAPVFCTVGSQSSLALTEGRVSRALGRPLTWLRITPLREGTGLDDVMFPSALTFYGEFRALVKSNFNKRIIWKILWDKYKENKETGSTFYC